METMNVKTATEKFNEVANVKMAAISKSRRPAARVRKEFANEVLVNQSDYKVLQSLLKDNIYNEVLNDLMPYLGELIKAVAPVKKSVKKADTTAQPAKRGAAPKHVVGDVDPTNSNYVWTEYAPGKFSWRKKDGKHYSAAVAHKVGDVDPTNSNYVWVEYKEGKFDWRNVKHPAYQAYLKRVEAEAKKAERKAKKAAKKAVPAA